MGFLKMVATQRIAIYWCIRNDGSECVRHRRSSAVPWYRPTARPQRVFRTRHSSLPASASRPYGRRENHRASREVLPIEGRGDIGKALARLGTIPISLPTKRLACMADELSRSVVLVDVGRTFSQLPSWVNGGIILKTCKVDVGKSRTHFELISSPSCFCCNILRFVSKG